MFDLNAIVNAALNAAIQAATEPLITRIAALESANDILHKVQGERIAALENNPAIGVDTTLERRVAVLEGSHQMSADAFVTHLDNQEWFWHKIAGFVANNSEITGHDLEVVKDRIAALESETQSENRYLNRDEVNDLIQEAIDDHLGTYDHDDYDNHIGDDDKHFDGDIEDAVRDALSNMSFDVTIR